MDILRINVDKYGFLSIPIVNGIKSITGRFISFNKDEKGYQILSNSYSSCITISYENVSLTVYMEYLYHDIDDIKDFEKIEISLSFTNELIAIKYHAYTVSSLIKGYQTNIISPFIKDIIVKEMRDQNISIQYDKVPYKINIGIDCSRLKKPIH